MLNTPFDVVKTRIQNSSYTSPNGFSPWTLVALYTLFKEEGFRACYKGFVPKVLRLGPGGGILLVVFDTVIDTIKNLGIIYSLFGSICISSSLASLQFRSEVMSSFLGCNPATFL
jgi:hypothetical protein